MRNDFENELTNLNSVVGWSKCLEGLLQFLVENIENTQNMVIAAVLPKSKVVKKYFSRAKQLLEEQYFDIRSIFTKQSDEFFCFKRICGTSVRKRNIIIFVALIKAEGSFAYI